jgi:D-3-phosphoglycerate dehydrogenase
MAKGRWKRWEYIGVEIVGKTLGILGIGRIGTIVAKRAGALGMKVIAFDPNVAEQEIKRRGARKASWNDFLKKSDFLSLHAPLTRETEGLFGKAEFAKMKPDMILVNTARAAIVGESALLDALSKHRIRGAAIDVYDEEPLSRKSPLRHYAQKHKNLILTPHLGASTREAISEASLQCARELKKYSRYW